MQKPQASFNFSLPLQDNEAITMSLTVQAFIIPEKQPEVLVNISVNGHQTGVARISKAGSHAFSFVIPPENIEEGGAMVVEFLAESTLSPMEAGMGGDNRELSIGLIDISFQRIPISY
jgi:hypothetical protein